MPSHADQPQRSVQTRKKMSVVMAIVIVTAMPYAAARLLAVWNPITSPDARGGQQPVHQRDVDLARECWCEVWSMRMRGR